MTCSIAFPFQNDFVSAMAEPVNGCGPQDAIGEGVRPLRDIEVGSDNRAFAFIAFRDHVVEVFILDSLEGFEAEVVNNEKIDFCQPGEEPLIAVGGLGGVELGEHPGGACKEDIIAGADGRMTEGLGDMAFACSAGAHDEDGDLLFDKSTACQVRNKRPVEAGVEGEIELFEGFGVAEVGPADREREPLLASAGDLVLDDDGQEIHIGELLVDSLAVAQFNGIQDAGES